MPKLNLGDKDYRCPLCGNWFEKIFDGPRGIFVYACHWDRVKIACDDPFVGKWDQAAVVPPDCPGCGAKMRYFGTSTGYVKFRCSVKKCSATIASAQPDRPVHRIATPERPAEAVGDVKPEDVKPEASA